MMLDCFYVYFPAGSDKQSDIGSSGSTLQGKKGETEPGAPMMPSVSEGPENGFRVTSVGEEVNSPVKKSRISKSPVKKLDVQAWPVTGNCDAVVLLQGVGNDAQPSSTAVALAHEWVAEEGLSLHRNPHLTIHFGKKFVDKVCCIA